MLRELTALEETIVGFCRENGSLSELCKLVDYDPTAGRVPEHWVPNHDVLMLAKHIQHTSKQ